MTPFLIALGVFASTFIGALLGIRSGNRLPEHHLSNESKDVVRICMSLIATLTALVLGLVTASAKEQFDAQDVGVRSVAASLLMLDSTLARFGPETQPIRNDLKHTLEVRIRMIWEQGLSPGSPVPAGVKGPDDFEDAVLALSPKNDRERWLQSQALSSVTDVLRTRWLALSGAQKAVPTPFLVVIAFWLVALFWSFGLFAPRNPTVIAVLMLASASVAASVLLILEMQTPFSGFLRISSAPLEYVLQMLGK